MFCSHKYTNLSYSKQKCKKYFYFIFGASGGFEPSSPKVNWGVTLDDIHFRLRQLTCHSFLTPLEIKTSIVECL